MFILKIVKIDKDDKLIVDDVRQFDKDIIRSMLNNINNVL